MLLSICIPVYNTDIRPLATELHRQSQSFSSEVELLFIDDASDFTFKEKTYPLSLNSRIIRQTPLKTFQ